MNRPTLRSLALAGLAMLMIGLALPADAGSSRVPRAEVPDGRIAFSNDCQIYTINPDGSALVQVTHFSTRCADFPSWSPDSTRIAYQLFSSSFDRASVYASNADGTDLLRVTTDGAGYYDVAPDYTPDGQRIAYQRCRPDPPGGCAIYSVRLDGTDRQALTAYRTGVAAGSDMRPQVSPDGRWLSFSRFGSRGIQTQVWTMPMDGSARAHPITPARLAGRSAKWAPDSRTIDFAGCRPSGYGCLVFQMSATPPYRLTQLSYVAWPNGDLSPAFSPSGKFVSFISDRRYPDACCNELFVMHADGTHQHLLTGDLFAGVPDWGTAPLQTGVSDPVAPASPAARARAARAQAVITRLEGGAPVAVRATSLHRACTAFAC